MKWKLISVVGLAAMLSLTACGNDDEYEEGRLDNDNPNVEQTRYNNNGTVNDPTRNPNINNNGNTNDEGTRDSNDANDLNPDDGDHDNNNNGDNNQYDVAEKAADKITSQIDVIDHAYVLTTDNNAYVAAALDDNKNNKNKDNGDKLTDQVKKKISDIVKSTDKDIDNVYVSTNPDFLDLADNYVNDADSGEPVEGFFDQIGNMIERVFPQDKD